MKKVEHRNVLMPSELCFFGGIYEKEVDVFIIVKRSSLFFLLFFVQTKDAYYLLSMSSSYFFIGEIIKENSFN